MMPGPFPGMDPYLEDPAYWQSVHNRLIGVMEGALNALLPLPYAAYAEMRCYIERADDALYPDVFVQRRSPASGTSSGGKALAESGDPPLHFHVSAEETREAYLEIRDVKRKGHVITTVELLSHTNKKTRNEGRKLYQEKQAKTLLSSAHLIEIDLLRAGRHTVAIPEAVLSTESRHDYLVCLHRAGAGGHFEVWLNTLEQRLPRIAVPLEEGLPDVILDLQPLLQRVYDEGAYQRKIDYKSDAIPPLIGKDAAWADALLREQGLRP